MKTPFKNPPLNMFGLFGSDFDFKKLPTNRDEPKITLVYLVHLACDALGLVLAYALAYWLRFDAHLGLSGAVSSVVPGVSPVAPLGDASRFANAYAVDAPTVLLQVGIVLFLLYAWFGLYRGFRFMRHTRLLLNLVRANGIVFLLFAAYVFLTRDKEHDLRSFLPFVFFLNIFTTWFTRRLFNNLLRNLHRSTRNLFVTRVLLVGEGKVADELERRSKRFELKRYHIEGRIPVAATPEAMRDALEAAFAAHPSYTCVMAAQDNLDEATFHEMRRFTFRHNMAAIVYEPDALELHNPFSAQDEIYGRPMVHYPMPMYGIPSSRLRTFAEQVVASLALVCLSPLFLVVAVMIKLEDKGPAFFLQERYGRDGKPFRMWKFRTMCMDAEAKLEALRKFNESDGGLFKMKDDPRITRVGAFLRKTSIDELPQLINIARGEMRFVGPRPLPCKDLAPYADQWYLLRQMVEPGLTCIWQVTGRSDIGFERMCDLDVWYALNRDWLLDLKIFIRTFTVVLLSRGAY